MTPAEVSYASDDVALVGALMLFGGLGLLPLGRLLAERLFPAPRVLFVRWGFSHLLVVAFIFLFASVNASAFFGGAGVVIALAAGMGCFALSAACIAWVARRTEPAPAESLGLAAAPHARAAGLGLGLYLLFFPALVGAGLLSPWLVEHLGGAAEGQQVLLEIGNLGGGELALGLFLATVLGPLFEELLFRGFLQPLLVQNFREGGGVCLTSLVFASLHGGDAFLPVFCLSLLLGAIYLRTRSLVAVALVHGVHNGVVLTLFLLSPEWRELSGASGLLGS